MPLLPEECEIRTVDARQSEQKDDVRRVTCFCYGSFGTFQGRDKHWKILLIETGHSLFGAHFHCIEDACNAMFDLGNIAVHNHMSPAELSVLFAILLRHNTCQDTLALEMAEEGKGG